MIIDLIKFVSQATPAWKELESTLDRIESDPARRMPMEQLARFHYLYQKAAADLTRIETFAAERQLQAYLESLVARAYAEIHETRRRATRLTPLRWFFHSFPQAFRRHLGAFWLSVAVTMAGALFGAGAISFDSEAKSILLPFAHLQGNPSDRVAEEERARSDRLAGHKSGFSAMLMTHNTKVAITTLALGMTWGIGTIVVLFFNGAILGAVSLDYIRAGEGVFLTGWLLPHGSVEIPSILLAGQTGFILAGALAGWRSRLALRARLRKVAPDLATMAGGFGVLLIWAGLVESFFSQYHEPQVPYGAKIAFGAAELALLFFFLARSGRKARSPISGAVPVDKPPEFREAIVR